MKNILAILILTLCYSNVSAQTDCNSPEQFIYQTDSVDKNTEVSFEVSCYFARIQDSYSMHWLITIKGDSKEFMHSNKIVLKLEDFDVFELKFSKRGEGKSSNGYTTYSSYIALEDWQLQILDKEKIKQVRLYWYDGYKDYDVVSPNISIKQLNCLY